MTIEIVKLFEMSTIGFDRHSIYRFEIHCAVVQRIGVLHAKDLDRDQGPSSKRSCFHVTFICFAPLPL
jgi:hypothetical protein